MNKKFQQSLTSIPMLVFFIGEVVMNSATPVNAAEKFEIKKEIVLSDSQPFHFSMSPAKGNGYFITGYIGGRQAWGAYLNDEGEEKWSYTVPTDIPPENTHYSHAWRASQYHGAISLSNGQSILCGHKNVGEETKPLVKGLLTKLDEKGNLIDQRLLTPEGDEKFKLNYIRQCGSWGDGYFLAGSAKKSITNSPGKFPPVFSESFFWLIALNNDGDIKWGKLISRDFLPTIEQSTWLQMSNGDLVFSGSAPGIPNDSGMVSMTSVLRVDQNGEVIAQRSIIGRMQLVHQSLPTDSIRLVPFVLKDGMFIKTLNDDLSDNSYIANDIQDEFAITRAIEMQDHSFFLTGYRDFRNPYATILQYTSDLNKRNDFVFKPKRSSFKIDDALPSKIVNEIATIRSVDIGKDTKNIFSIIKIKK
ncbi:hypothetical protein A7981_00965 [Methylovorus sp. MM2]|uniref:hypothetical protein n=1 Tax=Methylovorus sp. MM2 TaxID=1848038 RepID=UPI0007DF2271|nr:hypothetical protein [Methylovorus sp. MM2]OAM52091.1 hypothetical protein A7981_00965 [Methylovorus sp. MM2]